MNTQNFASLEACKRLVEAGIVLKTESCWRYGLDDKWSLVSVDWATTMMSNTLKVIPAPSMAEVWRELLLISGNNEKNIVHWIQTMDDWNAMGADVAVLCVEVCKDINALIDLLIFVRKEKP